jgi:integrase
VPTVLALIYGSRPSTWVVGAFQRSGTTRSLDRIGKKLGHKKVTTVRHRDIEELFNEVSQRAPIEANRLAAVASKLFATAVRWEMRADNPARGIERNPEEHRQRFLSGDELGRLFRALADHRNNKAANAIRLLALTGARRMEVLAATWEQFDLKAGVNPVHIPSRSANTGCRCPSRRSNSCAG